MKFALAVLILTTSIFAQYQHYPKFYASPAEIWEHDKLDASVSQIDTIVDGNQLSLMVSYKKRDDRLSSSHYKFIDNRLQQKRFSFLYFGDIDSTFKLADQHNKGILFLYTTTPQRHIYTGTGYYWKDYTETDLINLLKTGNSYISRYNLSNQDVIELIISYDRDSKFLNLDMYFTSREFEKVN